MVFSLSWDVFWANRLLRFFVSGGEILSQQNINNKAYLVLRVNSSFNGQRDCIDMVYVSQVLWAWILELDGLGWKPSSLMAGARLGDLGKLLTFPHASIFYL